MQTMLIVSKRAQRTLSCTLGLAPASSSWEIIRKLPPLIAISSGYSSFCVESIQLRLPVLQYKSYVGIAQVKSHMIFTQNTFKLGSAKPSKHLRSCISSNKTTITFYKEAKM